MINVWNKYGVSILYGNRETDIKMKTLLTNNLGP